MNSTMKRGQINPYSIFSRTHITQKHLIYPETNAQSHMLQTKRLLMDNPNKPINKSTQPYASNKKNVKVERKYTQKQVRTAICFESEDC